MTGIGDPSNNSEASGIKDTRSGNFSKLPFLFLRQHQQCIWLRRMHQPQAWHQPHVGQYGGWPDQHHNWLPELQQHFGAWAPQQGWRPTRWQAWARCDTPPQDGWCLFSSYHISLHTLISKVAKEMRWVMHTMIKLHINGCIIFTKCDQYIAPICSSCLYL